MCWHTRFNTLLALVTVLAFIGSSNCFPVSSESDSTSQQGTSPPSLESLSRDPKYTTQKEHFAKLRTAFLEDPELQKEHKAYLESDNSFQYTKLHGLIPASLVGKGDVPYQKSDTFFTDFAKHNDPEKYILSSTEDYLIIGNKASPDVRQYTAEWNPKNEDRSATAGMSYFHFMVIPTKKVYNVVSVQDTSIINDMVSYFKKFWKDPNAAQKCIKRIDLAITEREEEVLTDLDEGKTAEFKKIMGDVRQSSNEFAGKLMNLKDSDFFFGFQAVPEANIGHLQLHVIAMPEEMRKYSTGAHDAKTIPLKAVLEVIGEGSKVIGEGSKVIGEGSKQ